MATANELIIGKIKKFINSVFSLTGFTRTELAKESGTPQPRMTLFLDVNNHASLSSPSLLKCLKSIGIDVSCQERRWGILEDAALNLIKGNVRFKDVLSMSQQELKEKSKHKELGTLRDTTYDEFVSIIDANIDDYTSTLIMSKLFICLIMLALNSGAKDSGGVTLAMARENYCKLYYEVVGKEIDWNEVSKLHHYVPSFLNPVVFLAMEQLKHQRKPENVQSPVLKSLVASLPLLSTFAAPLLATYETLSSSQKNMIKDVLKQLKSNDKH